MSAPDSPVMLWYQKLCCNSRGCVITSTKGDLIAPSIQYALEHHIGGIIPLGSINPQGSIKHQKWADNPHPMRACTLYWKHAKTRQGAWMARSKTSWVLEQNATQSEHKSLKQASKRDLINPEADCARGGVQRQHTCWSISQHSVRDISPLGSKSKSSLIRQVSYVKSSQAERD